MRSSCRALALLWLLAAAPVAAQTFVFHLSSDQEVPPPPSASGARGGCMGTLNQAGRTFAMTCVHDADNATVMHVHRGAAGENGDVAFDLGDPTSPVVGTWTAMTDTDIAQLLAGELYVNVHTAGRPSGEIRGQILSRTVDLVAFTAEGSQVVPPTATQATADCTADLSTDATSLALACTHSVVTPDAAHVHVAPAGENGPTVFTFGSPASPLGGALGMTAQRVAELAAGFLYLDVHRAATSEADPGEEIRGQITDLQAGAETGVVRIVKATLPAGGESFAFAENITGPAGNFVIGDGQTQTFAEVPVGTYTVTEEDPAEGGWALADVSCSDADSTGDAPARTATVRLQAGETVTCTFVNVAVDPAAELFVFHLDGSQEVPPVASPARGGCFGQLDPAAGAFTLVCVHDVDQPTLMHIHYADTGAIAFDLGSPVSPVVATWSGMTPTEVAELLAGDFYVNIHTAGRPGGEIRGAILERTVDELAFPLEGSQVVPPDATPATGDCTADLADDATTLRVDCTHDLPTPDAAHVHAAPRGQAGPVVHTFATPTSPFGADVPMTPRTIAEFAAFFLYVDVHQTPVVEGDPEASIRGQIGDPPAVASTGTIRISKVTQPASGTAFPFTSDVPGGAAFALANGQSQTLLNVPAGTYIVTEGDPALLGHALTDISCGDGDSTGDPFARTATVRLQPGETVSCTFTNLATAGGDELFVFHLSGDQEVPPVASTHRGGCYGRLRSAASELTLFCVHDVPDATLMHVHYGAPGVNGPPAFDLPSPDSPVQGVWTGMTAGDVADLRAGRLYVNVHTAGRPAGEIRGQLVARSVDSFAFPVNTGQYVAGGEALHLAHAAGASCPLHASASSAPAAAKVVAVAGEGAPAEPQGTCTVDLDDPGATLAFNCVHDLTSPTAAHLHEGAIGEVGPVVFTFPSPLSPFAAGVPTTPRLLADFAAGFLYVEVHREGDEGVAATIRGQVLPGILGGPVAPVAIPTLGTWAAIALGLALAALGLRRLAG
jgi:hypothetical protein